MGKKARVLLISMVTMCMSLALIVCATYALFTGQVDVNNHLAAGSLEVGFLWTGTDSYALNDKGVLEEKNDTFETPVDLTLDNSELFNISGAVPGSSYTVNLQVSNKGSVAFEYGVRILWEVNTEDEVDDELETLLAGQIEITVTCGSETRTFLLSASAANDVDLGVLYAGADANTVPSQDFSVTATFVDNADNNKVQNISLNFDLQVYATQATDATTTD